MLSIVRQVRDRKVAKPKNIKKNQIQNLEMNDNDNIDLYEMHKSMDVMT